MPEYVSDTHSLTWYLTNDARLPATVRSIFEGADNGENVILIPSICLVEIIYLVEKARYPEHLIRQVIELVDESTDNYVVIPLSSDVIRVLQEVDRNIVPEMPDRIIAASAKYLELPLLSADKAITSLPDLTVIW